MATSQASATIGGTPENPILNLVLPTGPKGEPGGFTAGTSLGTANLDTITTPGLYRQASSGATLALNYPVAGKGYSLVVYPSGSTLVQIAYPFSGVSSAETGRVQYERVGNGTSWSPWRTFASQRVDDTAGKAIYTWDDVANREQLIYGDTGLRDITALSNATAGGIFLQRTGNMVWAYMLEAVFGNAPATGNATYDAMAQGAIPEGFRPPGRTVWEGTTTASGGAKALWVAIARNGWLPIYGGVNSTHVIRATISYPTPDAWPTSLPGVAA